MALLLPMVGGLVLIGIRRAADKSVRATFVFKFFQWKYVGRFFGLWLIAAIIFMILGAIIGGLIALATSTQLSLSVNILIALVCIILGLGLLYLIFAFLLGFPLIADRGLGPWRLREGR